MEGVHSNRKRCEDCVLLLKVFPEGRLTEKQIAIVTRNAGIIDIKKIAVRAGTSVATIKRWSRNKGISFNVHSYKKEVIEEVCAFYAKNGKVKTQEQFPNVKVRSIVERFKIFPPRQSRWTDKQIIQAVKMSCFVSFSKQALFFNRPLANAGSIQSLWVKNLKARPTEMHGLPTYKAKLFIRNNCPSIKLPLLVNEDGDSSTCRRIHLWIDLEKFLLPDCPEFIKSAIEAMAMFQRWVWGEEDIRSRINDLISQKNYQEWL